MSLLQFLLIQINLVIFYFIYLILVSGRSHRSLNRWYLLIMPFIAFVLPFISFGSSSPELNWVQQLPVVEILADSAIGNPITEFQWDGVLYLIGISFFVVLTSIQLVRAFHRPIATFYRHYNGKKVYLLREHKASYSFFNRIYLNPKQLENEQTILLHEYAHCREYHSLDLILSAMWRALLWFNPIVHFWDKRIRENHEYIADQFVLDTEASPAEYSRLLLESTFDIRTLSFVSAFSSKSLLLKRIEKLNHKNQYRMKHLFVIPVVAGITFLTTSMNSPVEPVEQNTEKSIALAEIENPAEFPGGKEGLMKFIMEEIKYPKKLEEMNIEGSVFIEFEISKTGKVENAKVASGSSYDAMDAEALRVVQIMPNWKPATKDGKPVRSSMKLPFKFKL